MKTSTLRIKEVRFQAMESPEVIPFMFKSSFEVQKQVFGFLWVSVISFNNPTSAIDFVNTVHQRELGLPEYVSAQNKSAGIHDGAVEIRGKELSSVVYPKEQCAQLNVYLSTTK